jgi:hypothetical protein
MVKTVVFAASILLLPGAGLASAQTVSLKAASTFATLPDGQSVPMWGYTCSSAAVAPATCAALNPGASVSGNWSPVVITVPPGNLTISLQNSLPGTVPTSLVVVGQLGGGLGAPGGMVDSPVHPVQGATWPIAGDTGGATFTPPVQPKRVQSFGTEIQQGATTSLNWTGLRPGTYLIESGTHPSIQGPMGLYGILVVTTAPTTGVQGTAYSGVKYDADVPLLLSEIDLAQNRAVATAVANPGFSETATVTLNDTVSSVSVDNPGSGYTSAPAVTFSGGGGTLAAATAVIDPSTGMVTAINVTNPGKGYTSVPTVHITGNAAGTAALSLATALPCGGTAAACYPPAVNYSPLYYLVNGVSFDKNNPSNSSFAITAPASTGQVLVRFVNAGLRMHVPSIVGAQTSTAAGVVPGLSLIAEDGNVLPGTPRVQNEVFLAAGKTYDVMINASGSAALPVFDRQLSLSTNNHRDGGMQAYININGGSVPSPGGTVAAGSSQNYFCFPGKPLSVLDPSLGLLSGATNAYGLTPTGLVPVGSGWTPLVGSDTLVLNADGTFTYTPSSTAATSCGGTINYKVNGTATGSATITQCVSGNACFGGSPLVSDIGYTSNIASRFQVAPPGVLLADSDPQGHPLTASAPTAISGGTVTLNPDGSFVASPTAPPTGNSFATVTFQYTAINSQGTSSDPAHPATVTVKFNGGSGLQVNVLDAPVTATGSSLTGSSGQKITDYRWIIEEDRTFHVDPSLENAGAATPQSLGTNFHTSYMPVVAAGCVGTIACESGQTVLDPATQSHLPAVCDIGNGGCRTDAQQQVPVDPAQVHLDPTKHYYISILPGDAGNSFTSGAGVPQPVDPHVPDGPKRQFNIVTDCGLYSDPNSAGNWAAGSGTCGHGMGGAQIGPAQQSVNVLLQETPFQTAKISVFVYEDDNPLNGENDAGGGVDILAPNEPGLGGFELRLWDDAGGTGDATGQMTYDMFNMPLSNSLQGTPDPTHGGQNACPISSSSDGLVGRIVTCPKYEADGVTLSPLAGQAVIANMMPGRYAVQATPGADRFAKGEEWLQTNTLDGQKAHDSFIKVGGPAYFQEFGPAGFHTSIGFANPKVINGRHDNVCAGTDLLLQASNCTNTVKGTVTEMRQSHPPDQRLYSSTTNDALSFTQCYVSLGDPDGEDFIFAKCDSNGHFELDRVPQGDWRITVFDQWNDQIVDGLSTPVGFAGGNGTIDFDTIGGLAVQQWHTNFSTSSFFDTNGNGVRDPGEPGLSLLPTNIRFRDGSYSNFNNTDLNGNAGYNEIFPLFNWYVIETDTTRFKQTGVHVVYDGGGPADGTPGAPAHSDIGNLIAGTQETHSLPTNLRVPGAVYCADADCSSDNIMTYPHGGGAGGSTGRIDPPWVTTEGWQGFIGQYEFLEFGKKPFDKGENGGIHGEVIYASTRPFDDPALLIHTSWTPDVPNVTVNLYQETTALDGTTSLKLVDTTKTSSWDDWAQGFRSDGIPNMNCPGQFGPTDQDPFYFTLKDTPFYLDTYANGGSGKTLPVNSQFKCYDGLHNFNQVQPAPYDGMYQFPSVIGRDVTTGEPTGNGGIDAGGVRTAGSLPGTNCTICVKHPKDSSLPAAVADPLADTPMLPPGKYVVEMIVPPGYELVKEEDKNILIGDNYIAPVTQQFAGLGSIFILPDQASLAAAYNANNAQNPTNTLGRPTYPTSEGDTGSVETFWPCVGQARIVPDYISLFPQSLEVAPFAGATRNLCDRKEVTLADQASALAKFWVFSSTHVAAHFSGFILDDLSSEFDPFSPQFGEKFAVPNLPISIKDFAGNEVERVYTDQWGVYNGLNYSTWEVNPPNPTGYAPTMMVACMNDPGNGATPDPYFNPAYSQFCYEIPYMPGQTQYMDTPVVPTAAFAEGYNPADCAYPDATPAIKEVDGDGIGPWVDFGKSSVGSLALGNSGQGYKTLPTVGFAGGGGSGATATANLKVVAINPGNNLGTGYTAATTTVTLAGGGGSGATATANISGGKVVSYTVTNPGSGYTSQPTVTVTGGNSKATGTAAMGVSSLTLTAGGSSYTSAPTVTFTGGGLGTGVPASASAALGTSATQVLTITALGDKPVPNPAYTGPQATKPGFTNKFVTRHYGFGTTPGTVTIGGVVAPVTSGNWTDGTIKVAVPAGVPSCAANGPLQRNSTGGVYSALCGQLVIKNANGQSSIDAITVTVGGKAPTLVTAETPANNAIQTVIDNAAPGDLLIVPPGTYNEMILMWKPVRLQGVGAASSIVNANTHPSGKMDPWRRQVNCLFGLATNGALLTPGGGAANVAYDPTNTYTCSSAMQGAVDPLPLEGIVGWDTTLNGNLAELLQEPSLMGAYEGAAITVLGKGMNMSIDASGGGTAGTEGDFPTGAVPLTTSTADCTYVSNFLCNPSRIDGLSLTNSSQGGGGIFVHAWNHYLEIANNRIYGNAGTLSGGINLGQGESPDAVLDAFGNQLGFNYDQNTNVHNNSITANSSYGDELFSASPSAAGGVTFCTGADNYKFRYNWVCGNLSTGDGGGVVHEGFITGGSIDHNWILFNQSNNITIPTNGGGIAVLGAAPDGQPPNTPAGTECGSVTDLDCAPGLSDGTGSLVIDSNVIMGNTAESGSGGGIRLQTINGTEVSRFPNSPAAWYEVDVTNNIIANNVAGWDGGGISLQDALKVNIINNTIVNNDTTASAGVLFNTLGAPGASTPPPGCDPVQNPTCIGSAVTTSTIQAAGLVTMQNTSNMTSAMATAGGITCPTGHPNCKVISYPKIENDLIYGNRTFNITINPNGSGTGLQSQQNLVVLVPALNQTVTGQCLTTGTPGPSYWDIGVRGDSGPTNPGYKKCGTNGTTACVLSPSYSILTDTAQYPGLNNISGDPHLASSYCNGSRVPPENGGFGYIVPPGISDATVPNPTFNLQPAATVDEGNNWINMQYGPLSLANPTLASFASTPAPAPPSGTANGNYELTAASTNAIGKIPSSATTNYGDAPPVDLLGTPRKSNGAVDIGAIEFSAPAPTLSSISPTTGGRGLTVPVTLTGTNLTGATAVNVSGAGISVTGVTAVNATTVTASFVIAANAALTARNVSVTAPGGTTNTVTFTVVTPPVPTLASIAPNSGQRGITVPVTLIGTNLTGATAIAVSGAGVSVNSLNVVNDTTVTANFVITTGAALTARNVSITAPGGTSNTVTFTVTGPTLASINPTTGLRGKSVPVTLTGVGLTGATSVTVSGTGVTVSGVTAVNDTTVTATFAIAANATLSGRNVAVVTPIGTTNTVTFTVGGPSLASVAPITGNRGASVPVTLTGVELTGATSVTVSGTGVTVSGVTVVNDTTVTATFAIAAGANLSGRNVAVVTPNGTTNNVTFTIQNPPAPALTTIAPTSGAHNTSVPVILTGTNLTATSAITVSGGGITVSGLTVVNDTSVKATFAITNGAAYTIRTVSVTTPGGNSNTVTFTVN